MRRKKAKAIEYMTMLQSRVAVTTDMWTADSQKKGYMAVTGHFVDESWKLRSILMGYSSVFIVHICCFYCCKAVVFSQFVIVVRLLFLLLKRLCF